ncbi:MAG: SAM-dependent methyltransferase [Pseudomonadota bacterium]|nr:SAM-dependent methyltransferase [Pseudomonadota bacterium]
MRTTLLRRLGLAGSRMAEVSAQARADHRINGHTPLVFNDPYAFGFLNPNYKLMVQTPVGRWSGRLTGFHLTFLAGEATMVTRGRYNEEQLTRAISAGVTQYVMLGAGFDSFVWRHPNLAARLRVFEVDQPAAQASKRARARALGLNEPQNVIYVPVDLQHDSLRTRLLQSGFEVEKPAFFSWLGTAYYLSREAAESVIDDITRCAAPGSWLVFDYMDPKPFSGEKLPALLAKTLFIARAFGEPLQSGMSHGVVESFLSARDFHVLERLGPEAVEARYLRDRRDLTTVLPHIHYLTARNG